MEADLELGLKDMDLIPMSPQRLGHVIDAYDGHDTGTTSGILVRKIGNPQFKCGFRNELNWVPQVLTLGGRFPVGHFGIVATKFNYKNPKLSTAREAVFIGEMWITLANRRLAELYMHVINDKVKINGNDETCQVMWAGYMLSSKDIGEGVDQCRIDSRVWKFPQQFNDNGEFLGNSCFLSVTR